ncbi:aldo/keto reductase [Wenxinia saemankumensis]|uniref:Predicted oxidoreductase n=1 Tax=Wenxinia saemankumensis TaxID=1447782 RepID=A0A1M6C3B4_9RHOB|nr:aldo/keto reductase [Wenxinia saemankumensis]SHI55188.1 Predicted oxidoreductase [Wenxinia saemankumensis]
MKTRKLGDRDVSAIGLGCMSFAGMFGETDEATSLRCLDAAWDAGIDFLDTANVYGPHVSEQVVGAWIASRGHRPVIATKGGITRQEEKPVDTSEAYLRRELEGSLRRLGVDHVALYYAHRRDPDMSPEEIAGVYGRFIDEGLIGGYGLSEVAPATLRRAHAERPCMAVQSEYSLWTREPELGIVQACAELGIAFVPFSPLARGVFSERYPAIRDAFRGAMPRFSDENYRLNRAAIDPFKDWAHGRGLTVAAAALAWVLHKGDHMIPIPGTRTAGHLAEWAGAAEVALSDADMAEIETILPIGFAHGYRYSYAQMRSVERYA